MADASAEPFFMPTESGQRFCVYHAPHSTTALATVLYVHPFAEELNKSRRMAALQSRALAAAGCAVLQVDLRGCGDSSDDFGDASWSDWLADVVRAERWLTVRHHAPLWLWGLRAGCLIAAEAGQIIGRPVNHLYWQPPAAGRTMLQQFLRLKAAARLGDADAKGVMDATRHSLAQGDAVEVAGYVLSADLAIALERSSLRPPTAPGRVVWLELASREAAELLPASRPVIEAWRQAGLEVTARAVQGPAFWQTQEIEEAPALLEASVAALLATHNTVPV